MCLGHLDLPFNLIQGGESFDFAQDREPVERLVEVFCALCLETEDPAAGWGVRRAIWNLRLRREKEGRR